MSNHQSTQDRQQPMSDAEARLSTLPFLHRRSTAPIAGGSRTLGAMAQGPHKSGATTTYVAPNPCAKWRNGASTGRVEWGRIRGPSPSPRCPRAGPRGARPSAPPAAPGVGVDLRFVGHGAPRSALFHPFPSACPVSIAASRARSSAGKASSAAASASAVRPTSAVSPQTAPDSTAPGNGS